MAEEQNSSLNAVINDLIGKGLHPQILQQFRNEEVIQDLHNRLDELHDIQLKILENEEQEMQKLIPIGKQFHQEKHLDLRLISALMSAEGPLSPIELASRIDEKPQILYPILTYLKSEGVMEWSDLKLKGKIMQNENLQWYFEEVR